MCSMSLSDDKNDSSDNHHHHQHSDFSIEHILKRAGRSSSSFLTSFSNFHNCSTSSPPQLSPESLPSTMTAESYSWLQCTRFCPPRVPRSNRRQVNGQRRQLGRHPRIPFTFTQLNILESKYQETPYLSSGQVAELAQILDLTETRVKIWFQNRRARERREKPVQFPSIIDLAKTNISDEKTEDIITEKEIIKN